MSLSPPPTTSTTEAVPSPFVRFVEFHAHSHATEDVDVVQGLLTAFVAPGSPEQVQVTHLSSNWGSPLRTLGLKLTSAQSTAYALKRLAGLEATSKRVLARNLGLWMDGKNTLNLRLDKQWLCLGRFRIVDHSDVVLVKIRLGGQWKQRLKVEDVIGYLKSLGIL